MARFMSSSASDDFSQGMSNALGNLDSTSNIQNVQRISSLSGNILILTITLTAFAAPILILLLLILVLYVCFPKSYNRIFKYAKSVQRPKDINCNNNQFQGNMNAQYPPQCMNFAPPQYPPANYLPQANYVPYSPPATNPNYSQDQNYLPTGPAVDTSHYIPNA